MNKKHITLLGDSIFDNDVYVDKGDSVIDQLKIKLPEQTKATLLAVDGDVTNDVHKQLEKLPDDTTHLFISCGGNDALRVASMLDRSVSTVGDAMELFTEVKKQFENYYWAMLYAAKNKVDKVVVCTVYDSVPDCPQKALTALSMFNEVILKEAFRLGVSVIVRLVFNHSKDYSPVSPIEPSKYGSNKLSDLIINVLDKYDFNKNEPSIYI